MAHPLTNTVGTNVTASLNSHGRHDFKRGEKFKPHAAQAWRDGWIAEAELLAEAQRYPQVRDAMSLHDAGAALMAANRVLRHCTVSRPTRHQADVMAEARPLIEQAVARFEAAMADADTSDGAVTSNVQAAAAGTVSFPD